MGFLWIACGITVQNRKNVPAVLMKFLIFNAFNPHQLFFRLRHHDDNIRESLIGKHAILLHALMLGCAITPLAELS